MQRRASAPCSIKAAGHISTTARSSSISLWSKPSATKVKFVSDNVGDFLPVVQQLSYIAIKNDKELDSVRRKKHKRSPHHRRARAVLMGAILEYKPMKRDVLPSYYRYTM